MIPAGENPGPNSHLEMPWVKERTEIDMGKRKDGKLLGRRGRGNYEEDETTQS